MDIRGINTGKRGNKCLEPIHQITFTKMGKKKINVFSLIIGISLGLIIGFFLGDVFSRFIESQGLSITVTAISMVVFTIIGAMVAIRQPVPLEWSAFAFSGLIFTNALWDGIVNDWNTARTILLVSAILLFFFNIFTGKVRIDGMKVIKRTFGLR